MIRERSSIIFGLSAASGGGGADPVILSSASIGTPASQGFTAPSVSSNTGSGQLYWAIVTNGGSCTDAQLVTGAGGNIVAGKAGNQAVTGSGAQTTANVTGLAGLTTYQIKFLHIGGNNVYSAQASASGETLV